MRTVLPLACTWSGIALTVIRLTDTSAHRWVEHAYPGVDGVELESVGAEPRRFDVEAVFFGATWFADMAVFMGAVEQPTTTTPSPFVHPFLGTIFGCIPQATVTHEDRKNDCAIVRFSLIEGKLAPFAFTSTSTLAGASVSAETAAASLASAAAALP